MEYEVVIGLEVHAELSTKTKIYCGCPTEFGSAPNTHCCPVCTGMPGALPVLNEKVVEYAVRAGLATNCEIAKESKQDRKNYFYPDTPRAYQISQFDLPLCAHGHVDVVVDGKEKTIYIYNVCDHQECYKEVESQAISYTTGVPAMIGSMMVVTGQWKKPGVFNVEEFDPDPYMEALNKWGLPWKVCEDPELVKVWKANED